MADYKTFHHVYGTWDGGDFLCNQCNITGERYTMYQDRNILNNLTHEYSLSIEHDVILKIEHVFEWLKKEKWIMPGFLFLWFSVSLENYSLYILGLAEFQDNRVFQKMPSAVQNIN